MKLSTVNVVEWKDGSVYSISSFDDSFEGESEASKLFWYLAMQDLEMVKYLSKDDFAKVEDAGEISHPMRDYKIFLANSE